MSNRTLDLLIEIRKALLLNKVTNFVCHKCRKVFPSKMLIPASYKGEFLLFCGDCKHELTGIVTRMMEENISC